MQASFIIQCGLKDQSPETLYCKEDQCKHKPLISMAYKGYGSINKVTLLILHTVHNIEIVLNTSQRAPQVS